MPHIHAQDGQHDLTISMYIIRTDFAQPKLLLHKHKKLNKWMQFGGHVELNENPWQAVEHELLEETGYELSQLKLLQPEDRLLELNTGHAVLHPQPACVNTHPIATPDLKGAKHYHIDIGYVFVSDQEPSQLLADGESNEFGLFTRDELDGLKGETWDDTLTICRHAFDVCLPKWERVSL